MNKRKKKHPASLIGEKKRLNTNKKKKRKTKDTPYFSYFKI